MNYNCPICCVDPSSHSLVIYKEINNIIYLYTCPSESKLYFDTKGIIIHYDGILSQIPEDKKWVWVIDSKYYSFKHFIEFNVGIELLKLISSKFSKNLLNIIVINPTIYIKYAYNFLTPFLSKELKKLIIFNTECKNIEKIII
jgi:hypothetical protein